ncbi:MAG TPA: cytochrome c [Steroidobacteraceae bacterium]
MRPTFRLMIIGLLGVAGVAHADDERAHQNYLLHCMGCHTESGVGLPGKVPSLRGTLARLADDPDGRSYVLRVPGVTQSTLEPARLAEVLNWAMREFSDTDLVASVQPFTAAEVAAARDRPLLEVTATRQKVLQEDH